MHVEFGGPDRPAAALAELLQDCIERVPPGGEIHWITYYFGNRRLAQSLLAARRRGVNVSVDIESHPRRPQVNVEVIQRLRELGTGGLRELRHVFPCHVHEKIYYFSHPRPFFYLGSYNPSRGEYDPSELLEDIGDQDRGHNFLVAIDETTAVSFIHDHMQAMHQGPHGPLERFGADLNKEYHSAELSIWHYPRRKGSPHIEVLNASSLERVRIAASHFRDPAVAQTLVRLARRGAAVEVVCHDSLRRVPLQIEKMLMSGGALVSRYRHAEGLPMHNKFMLLEAKDEASVVFGSLNLTRTSRWLNHEILVKSTNPGLFAAFLARWKEIAEEIEGISSAA